jgi:hypothetical protein
VRIELVRADTVVRTIVDSVSARAQGFLWQVPVSTPLGTDYRIRITARSPEFAGIRTTGENTVTITDVVSVADDGASKPGPVRVYPVPAADHITVENIISGCARVEVYALSGVCVARASGIETHLRLPLVDVPTGAYIVRVTDHAGRVFSVPFSVER